VLEFDHVGEKRTEVSTLVRRGVRLDRISAEIANCEAVCANCHRRRTARRGGWRRLFAGDAATRWRSAREERNARHAYSVLKASGCVDCGLRELVVLEFDHIGTKSAMVMRLVRNEASLAKIDREIAECEVRCANCHRRRTATTLGHHRTKYPQGESNPRYEVENLACYPLHHGGGVDPV
jgi:cytochrome c553